MSLKSIRLRPEAELEIEDAFEYYGRKSSRVAVKFLAEIGISFQKICANPRLYPPYTKSTRRRILGTFPYSVIYQEKDDVILIIAIAHAKCHEAYWIRRINQ